jgi:hypothetical protein
MNLVLEDYAIWIDVVGVYESTYPKSYDRIGEQA